MHRDIADFENRLAQCCPPNGAASGPLARAAFSRCARRRQRPAGSLTPRQRRRTPPVPPVRAALLPYAGRARARWPRARRIPAAAPRPGSAPASRRSPPGCSSQEIRPVASVCGCAANCSVVLDGLVLEAGFGQARLPVRRRLRRNMLRDGGIELLGMFGPPRPGRRSAGRPRGRRGRSGCRAPGSRSVLQHDEVEPAVRRPEHAGGGGRHAASAGLPSRSPTCAPPGGWRRPPSGSNR